MKHLPSETDMQRIRDRNRIAWGLVAALIALVGSVELAGSVRFVLCIAAALFGGALGGALYAWTWRLRELAWAEESLAPGAGLLSHKDKNCGPLWRKLFPTPRL